MTQRSIFPSLFIAVIAWLLAGCSAMPMPSSGHEPLVVTIYVIERGWHTDIALPATAVTGPLVAVKQGFSGASTLVFGFGDRAYVMSRSTDLITTVAALFPDQAALLVTALDASPSEAFGAGNVVALRISQSDAERVSQFLWEDLAKDPDGEPSRLGDGPYPGSAFYASVGTYDAFHTCNRWAAEALQAASLPVSNAGVVFAWQVMGQARRLQARQSRDGVDTRAMPDPIRQSN